MKYSRKNENGVYIDYEQIVLWKNGANFFAVEITFTPEGYRGVLYYWYKRMGSCFPITDKYVPYSNKEQCIYNVIKNAYKEYCIDYYVKNEPKMIEILRRLMGKYQCSQLELF